MKNKFLSLALVTALVAVLAMPTTFATQTLDDAGTAQVTVTGDTELTIALAGDMQTPTFSNITAGVSNDSETLTLIVGTDTVVVTDYTGVTDAGHNVAMAFDTTTWTYAGSDTNYGDVNVATATGNPGDDVMLFEIIGTSSNATFSLKAASTCTSGGASAETTFSSTWVDTTARQFISSTEDCPGTSTYTPNGLRIVAPQNGLGEGTYTISGTVTLTDGA